MVFKSACRLTDLWHNMIRKVFLNNLLLVGLFKACGPTESKMEGIKKILVAVDLSGHSQAALRLGARLAQALDAEIRVVSVINQRDVEAVRLVENTTELVKVDDFIKERSKEREAQISDLLGEAHCKDIPFTKSIRVGVPWEEILLESEAYGADLVVVGTKGRGNAKHVFFGSNAEKVYRRSKVSVLSARGKEHAELVCKLD